MNPKLSSGALIALSSAVLFVIVSLSILAKAGVTGEAAKSVAIVGKTAITEKEIFYKVQIEKAYGNEGVTAAAALISLINDALEHEVAGIHDVSISRGEIESFKKYVDESTKAPEILQEVKSIFADDLASYEQIYLSPKIMNRKLRSFYSTNRVIHKKEIGLIEKAYGLVISGKGFQDAAEQCGLKSIVFDISEKEEDMQAESVKFLPHNSIHGKDPLLPILETLNTGEVYKNIIEDDFAYRIIRLITRRDKNFSVEAITVNKRPFDEWIREESAGIKIEIRDSDLKDKIKSKYPDIWWVKGIL